MIHTYVPYCPKDKGQNLGFVYNKFMEMIEEDDWACFLDHDAAFTTKTWYHQLNDIIEKYPDVGMFTCIMNRTANIPQRLLTVDYNNHDIKYHRKIGKYLQEKHYYDLLTEHGNCLMSGVLILISKKTWKTVGGFKDGFLGVDNDIHIKCTNHGIKLGIMRGVYLYHWYRADGDVAHLK